MKPHLGLTPKLALVFVLFALALLASVSGLYYNSGRSALEAATTSDLLSTAIEKQAALNRWAEERQSNIATIAANTTLIKHLRAHRPEGESAALQTEHQEMLAYLSQWAGQGKSLLALSILDPETGQVIASTDPQEDGKFREDRPYFINGKNGPFIQNVYYSLASRGPVMEAAAPIRPLADPFQGQLLGVLVGQLNLDEMNTIVQRRTGLRQTDDAFLVNTSHLFVTQPRLIPDPAVLQRGVHTAAVNHCLTRNSGAINANDYRGVPALIIYRWLPERELCLIVKVDQAEALASSRAFGASVLLISILVLLVASALAAWLARGITRPVHQLVRGTQEIGHGNLDYRIAISARDELGQLAEAFNDMAANLGHAQAELHAWAAELERRVAERTAALRASEERFRIAAQSASDLIWDWDISGGALQWFGAIDAMLGYAPGEFPHTFAAWEGIIHPDDHDRVMATLDQHLKTRSPYAHEYRVHRKDGTFGYWTDKGEALWDDQGNGYRMIGVCTDITARKRAEDALREAEQQFRGMFERHQAIMLLIDPGSGAIVNANASAARFYGFPLDKLRRMNIEEINCLAPEQVSAERQRAWTEQRNYFIFPHRLASGEIRTVEVHSTPITVGGGQLLFSIIHDISERERAEEALRTSQQLIEGIVNAIPVRVFWKDKNLVYLGCNTVFARDAGFAEPTDIIGKDDYQMGWRDQAELYRSDDRQVIETGCPKLLIEEPQTTPAGDTITLLTSKIPLRNSEGETIGVLGTYMDITERRRMEEALRESEEQYRLIVETAQEGVWQIDADSRTTFVNRRMAEMLGYTVDEMAGASLFSFMDDEGRQIAAENVERYRQGIAEQHDFKFRRKDGADLWAMLSTNPLLSDEGRYLGALAMVADISDRKQGEQALAQKTRELERSNAELEHFAHVASHDLQEPLRMVSSFMGLLAQRYQGQLDADADEFIGFAIDGAQRMQRLITGLLDYSRVGTRGRPLQSADAATALDDALWNLDLAIQDAGATVTRDPLPTVMADRDQLAQVFQNLIGNGIKFRGAEPPRVHISASETFEVSETSKVLGTKVWQFSVRDNGIGIAAGDIGRIFGIFQRLHAQAEYPGTGIGLATCKKIIERHGGRIWVESEVGQGTTFYFTIPVAA